MVANNLLELSYRGSDFLCLSNRCQTCTCYRGIHVNKTSMHINKNQSHLWWCWGSRNKGIPGVHCPAILVYEAASRPVEDPVSKLVRSKIEKRILKKVYSN